MPEMNRERLEVRRVKAKRALSYQKIWTRGPISQKPWQPLFFR